MENSPLRPETPDRVPPQYDVDGKQIIQHMNGAALSGINANSRYGGNMIGGGGGGGIGNPNNTNNNNNSNRVTSRRPLNQTIPIIEQQKYSVMPTQLLTLTIHKDSNGYGMKVSGDNPVFVENVKPGGAAQKAGLIPGDMILKINGVEVRTEQHTTVVSLIKSHVIVELTVKRSQKMQRPSSVGISPSTPILQRDRTASITGPQPVDNAKRREMEFSKIKTLQLMLEQEKKNVENLKTSGNGVNNRQERIRSEANIRKLQEQLRQVGGEDSPIQFFTTSPTLISPSCHPLPPTTPQIQNSSPAFLSRFPRSLSSLSLGTRRKTDKEITSPLSSSNTTMQQHTDLLSTTTTTTTSPIQQISQQSIVHQKTQHQNQNLLNNSTPVKKKFTGSERNLREDIPPPLPQRNPPRTTTAGGGDNPSEWRRNIPVSDLDYSMSMSSGHSPKNSNLTSSTNCSSGPNSSNNKGSSGKKRPKTKTKALSDPKMSTQMFLQMEKEGGDGIDSSVPPPLPPRQPGMMEETQNILNTSKAASNNMNNSGSSSGGCRPLPNSVDTLMNYPLVATCTPVRDNMSAAFPLSQRPNIVQQLQQHQQHLHQLHHNQSSIHSSSVNKPTMLGQTPQHMNHLHKHRRVVSSPEHMQPRHDRFLERHNKSSSGSWELLEKDNEATPPGTPPPPYLSSHLTQSQTVHSEDVDIFVEHNPAMASPTHPTFPNQILAAQPNTIQKEIVSMEDEEISDQECAVDEHGPFNYVQRLLEPENVAHLAVFLNYVLSNSDPSPLLFYLITGLYKEGTVKDMRKWAYEIHSTFLVPCAPLLWFNVDESLAREVDNVLQNEYDKVEILRKVFWKSRKKAKEKICDQLRDFQQKRTAGMGTFYGPTDQQLSEAQGDKAKEQKIFEDHLLPKLQHLVEELDKETPYECPKKLALCSALSTVLHRIFVTRSVPGSPIDRVHHFVSREKSFKNRLMGKSRKMVVRGHPLVLRQYYEVTHCNHCQTIIWGVSPQGYHCTDCKLNIHRQCSKVLEESCPGPVPQKRKEQHTDNKISKFMGKIRPTHHFIQNERARRMEEEGGSEELTSTDRSHTTSVVRQPSDCRPDLSNTSASSSGTGSASHHTSELTTSQFLDSGETNALDADHDSKKDRSKSKSAPVSVNRSESYKERLSHKRSRNNRRKTSDPSLSKTNDEQSEVGLSNSNYTASSSSSLSSSSLESPSISLEQVSGTGASATINAPIPIPRQWVDSDDEADLTEVDWSSNVAVEILGTLSDAEKKRQEIINEIYQTERNHVRTLKLLEGLFMRPLLESGVLPYDHLQLLFPPALITLKDLHSSFEQKLKLRRIEHCHIVNNVGDLLVGMFEGQSGDELREYAAQFCARQQIALEALKEKRRKDENLQRLLTKAESHKACRRLQLKDLLPTVLQRLTKYPLLFENLYKITQRVIPDDEHEADAIKKALDSSKRILVDVNQAVKYAEDAHKLQTIQRKLDKSSFDKDANNEFKNLDLTQFKLVFDGQLTMKKNPSVQLHGLLFENMMVLLHTQDDKYLLKYFRNNNTADTNENNKLISPITHFDQQTLVRQCAVEKNAFFLIITKTSQMLELRAPSSSECRTWFKHISDVAEQYKPRSKSSHEIVEDPASATLPHTNPKESVENIPEQINPVCSNINNNNFNTELQPPPPPSGYQDQNHLNNSSSIASYDKNNLVNNNNAIRNNDQNENKFENNNNASIDNRGDGGDVTHEEDSSSNEKDMLEPRNREDTRRESVYSNNSNDTRTLMQHCQLLEPTEIQVSIVSPTAHTAEPILTPTERLKRLDDAIRERLLEKQKIICDMFRIPNEHFAEITDIAGQPEAPKDISDVALAAFAQVQSLAEVLNDYTRISQENEISAVSTVVCDQCHQRNVRSVSPLPSSITSTNTGITVIPNIEMNRKELDDLIMQEDDGYCEIDMLRLPSVTPLVSNQQQQQMSTSVTTGSCIKPGDNNAAAAAVNLMTTSTPELTKRQSTISADSIPEETEQDITQEEITDNSKSTEEGGDEFTNQQSNIVSDEQQKLSDNSPLNSEHIEVNDTYDITATSLTKTVPESNSSSSGNDEFCGPNRLSHANSLGPSIPCHIISGIVTTLNAQISLLLPRINERDVEREQLRRENQHLRELLNAMHERQRVKEEKETPEASNTITINTTSAETDNNQVPDDEVANEERTTTTEALQNQAESSEKSE